MIWAKILNAFLMKRNSAAISTSSGLAPEACFAPVVVGWLHAERDVAQCDPLNPDTQRGVCQLEFTDTNDAIEKSSMLRHEIVINRIIACTIITTVSSGESAGAKHACQNQIGEIDAR